jgi:AAA+ superfamily predicted ATPase
MIIYKKLIYSAIAHSNLKGSYFSMPYNELSWKKQNLEIRDFEDVYLPKKIMQNLELFTGLYAKKGELMRYLFAGTPGTGKTEATIAIANILKQQGVTIIKTVVCDYLKDKIELAELLSPCLIIFDDLDLSLGSRTKGGVSRSLGTFLDAMDGTDKISSSVGIIATSNSIELLDQAASRPGRFDKLMSFDEITKDNIKKLILKSLRHNFGFGANHPAAKEFSDKKIIDFLYDSKQTGAWIFNSVKMVMRKIEILDLKVSSKFILDEFKNKTYNHYVTVIWGGDELSTIFVSTFFVSIFFVSIIV